MRGRPSDEGRNAGTFGALFGLLLLAGMLMALIAMVLPQAIGFVLVFGGFLGLISLHYLLWGCWLSRMLVDQDRAESALESATDATRPQGPGDGA
jgi:regulator of protease activity HflC (stomatin/prohibitin superfamily)